MNEERLIVKKITALLTVFVFTIGFAGTALAHCGTCGPTAKDKLAKACAEKCEKAEDKKACAAKCAAEHKAKHAEKKEEKNDAKTEGKKAE